MNITRPVRVVSESIFVATWFELAIEGARALDDAGCTFTVSGFGQERWPVSMAYDGSSVVEQLPQAINGLKMGQEVEIDFYGPGLERCITFSPHEDDVSVGCSSRLDWQPGPDIRWTLTHGIAVLEELMDKFLLRLEECGVTSNAQTLVTAALE
jgi:hypothetical protein